MADEDVKAPSADDEAKDTQPKEELTDKEWYKTVNGKFKSEADLAKAYKELESKFGKTSEEVRQAREFADIINPLLEEIRNDPEIFNKLDEKLRNKDKNSETPSKPETKDIETRNAASDLIIQRFEEKHGIDKLTNDERADVRKKIGDAIVAMTGNGLGQVDLRRLGSVLENAYILANKDHLVDKAKLDALAKAQNLDDASIGSIPSSPGKSEITLSPEESDIAKKLGLTRDQYLKGKKSTMKGGE